MGAKNVIRAATGPGLSFSGIWMPMGELVIRLSNCHSPCHLPSLAACFDGDTVSRGKSTFGKSVVAERRKLRASSLPGAAE